MLLFVWDSMSCMLYLDLEFEIVLHFQTVCSDCQLLHCQEHEIYFIIFYMCVFMVV